MTSALDRARELIEKADPLKTLPRCEIAEIEIGPGAIFHITNVMKRFVAPQAQIALIVDKTPIFRKKQEVKKLVFELLANSYSVTYIELEDGHLELHASAEVIAESVERAKGLDAIVTIGGGTITDIGKMTSLGLSGIPHIAIQTAASVDGYSDNVSVILINGVKRTVPSRWPEALIADTTLIAEAPSQMNRAGYGEINSMFTAPADWRLAALLGFEKKFHWGPIELLKGVGEGIELWSPGLKKSEISSIEKLVNALAIRGIVTGVADTTACLSGIEHLVSHMLDMHQTANHEPVGQHGAQVGVGSVFAAAVWELLFDKVNSTSSTTMCTLDKKSLEKRVLETFHPLDSTDVLGRECWKDYEKKVDFWNSNLEPLKEVLNKWSTHASELRDLIKSPEEIIRGLVSSGSPVSFGDLEPAIGDQVANWAVSNCHLMRNRFVGIDLLEFLGFWTQKEIDWVLARSRQAIEVVGVDA